jgi:transcription initiation factor IIE alpha subunit
VRVSEVQLPDLAVAAKVVDGLERHPGLDEVELVVDLGLDLNDVRAAIDALVDRGLVIERDAEGDQVYELSRTSAGASVAEFLSPA